MNWMRNRKMSHGKLGGRGVIAIVLLLGVAGRGVAEEEAVDLKLEEREERIERLVRQYEVPEEDIRAMRGILVEGVDVEATGMGWAQIEIALALASTLAESSGLESEDALSEVLTLRGDGGSWGEIASEISTGADAMERRGMARRMERERADMPTPSEEAERPADRGRTIRPEDVGEPVDPGERAVSPRERRGRR